MEAGKLTAALRNMRNVSASEPPAVFWYLRCGVDGLHFG